MPVTNLDTTATLKTTSFDPSKPEKFEFTIHSGSVGGFGVVPNTGYLWANWSATSLQKDINNVAIKPSWLEFSRTGAGYTQWTVSEQVVFNDIKVTEPGTYRIQGEMVFSSPDNGTNPYDFDPIIAWYFTDTTDPDINFGGTDDPDSYWDGFYAMNIDDVPTSSATVMHNARFNNLFTVDPRLGGSITLKIASIYNGDTLTNNSYSSSETYGSTTRSDFVIEKISNKVDPSFANYILR